MKATCSLILGFFATAWVVLSLSGCSLGKTYSQIDPEGAKEDIRQHTGYYALKSVSLDTTKLVLRSAGASYAVQFSTSTSTTACEGLEKQGTVRDQGRGVIYPWIANMGRGLSGNRGFLEQELETLPESIQVQGYASLQSSNTLYSTTGHCGPLTVQFQPKANRAYLVNFLFEGNACRMQVSDSTDPDAPIPVSTESIPGCKRG